MPKIANIFKLFMRMAKIMKADIWMPLYIGDYLADTARLSTEQHGAYLLLLMDYWRSGRLPDNDQVLAQICKLTPDAWSNAKAMLIPFFSIEQGFWVHKRVEQEMAEAKVNQTKKHERAVKAAEARWKNATSNANAMQKQCPSPSPSPSPVIKSNTSSKRFEEFWDAYGKKRGKAKALKEWQKAKITDELADKLIEQAKKQVTAIPDPQFRKDPERWIKGFHWEDEIVILKAPEEKLMPLGTDAQIEAAYRIECGGDPTQSRFKDYFEMRNYIIAQRDKKAKR